MSPKRRKRARKARIWPWLLLSTSLIAAWLWWSTMGGIRGVDVSRYQGKIDWGVVREAGIVFAFIKASEGKSLVDPRFADNWEGAKSAGVIRGAYHFFRPSVDAAVQARLFLTQFQQAPGDLPPVLDLEVTDGKSATEVRKGALKWLEIVEKKTGIRPILYTMPRFANDYLDTSFAKYPLWLVHLRRGQPLPPRGWKEWTFWQYSHRGHVRGIPEIVDMNLYGGTEEELAEMGRR